MLASGSGTNLQALIDACGEPTFPGRIVLVLSDRPNALAISRAKDAGIATEVVLKRDHPNRREWDAQAVAHLKEHKVDWVCLAGFMRLITDTFLNAYPNHVLNIHPALLPSFPGLHAQRQTLEHHPRCAGCTVHLVDGGTDTGPIIAQGVVPVLQGDDESALKARILRMEHKVYPKALQWACEGRITVAGRGVELHPPPADGPLWFDPTP